jgi:hypothetical protein
MSLVAMTVMSSLIGVIVAVPLSVSSALADNSVSEHASACEAMKLALDGDMENVLREEQQVDPILSLQNPTDEQKRDTIKKMYPLVLHVRALASEAHFYIGNCPSSDPAADAANLAELDRHVAGVEQGFEDMKRQTPPAGQLDDASKASQSGDYTTAVRLYRSLADKGDAIAQTMLGMMYAQGQGVPQDDAQAFLWVRKAADQGFAQAQGMLGHMYAMGRGVPRDDAKAFFWIRKGADKGIDADLFSLGLMYAYGHGVPQDYVQAHMWFALAGSRTEDAEMREHALGERDQVAAKMTNAQIAEAQRLAREWKPTK